MLTDEPQAATAYKGPGCARCRLDLVRFTREVKLPRFTVHEGEEWSTPQSRYRPDGSFELGAGTVPADAFELVRADDSRACNCACKRTG